MCAGPGGDAQCLFVCEVLGSNRGHPPRHATPRQALPHFAAECERLQLERIAVFKAYQADVASVNHPAAQHQVGIAPEELAKSMSQLPD